MGNGPPTDLRRCGLGTISSIRRAAGGISTTLVILTITLVVSMPVIELTTTLVKISQLSRKSDREMPVTDCVTLNRTAVLVAVGAFEGTPVGLRVGLLEGMALGARVGATEGLAVGLREGATEGALLGATEGERLGTRDGAMEDGWTVGCPEG